MRPHPLTLAFALAASLATLAAPGAAAGQAAPAEAPVLVFHRPVAVLRATLLGTPPATRAARARQIAEDLLERGRAGAASAVPSDLGRAILLDGTLVFFLTEEDVDRAGGDTLEAATRRTLAALDGVAAETAEGRDHRRQLTAALWSGLATALLAGALWLLARARRWLVRRLAALSERLAGSLHVGGAPLVGAGAVLAAARLLILAGAWLLGALLAYRWLSFVLLQFPITRPWGEQLAGYFGGVAGTLLGGALRALPDLLVAAAILLLARGAVVVASPFFDRVESGRITLAWLDPDTARPTRRIFGLAAWLFAVVMAYPYLPGSSTEAFKGMSVLIGLVVTFGGSSVFGQAASGLVLMYSRTLRVGEYVQVMGVEGTVTELGVFTTKIRTGLGEELSLPNAAILGTVTRNYSRAVRGPGYVVDTVVTIGYDTPWRQVEALLVEAARRTPGVLAEPAPRVFQTGLTDFYPEYRLVCQAVPEQPRPRAEVLNALHANVQDVFNEHGVQIMSPHYRSDPAEAKVVPRERWYAKPARPPGAT